VVESTQEDRAVVTIGIDTHKATLASCAVDELGRELAARTFANDPPGHRRLLAWASRLGPERRFGIEGSGASGRRSPAASSRLGSW
jgi:transposase